MIWHKYNTDEHHNKGSSLSHCYYLMSTNHIFKANFHIVVKIWNFFLSIQWFLDENHQIKKRTKKKSRFLYMVQVGSQKFTRIFQFLLHILLIAKLGYISLWMIATFTASKNWEKNIEEPDIKKGMKYIIKVHKMLIEKEKVRDLLHIFWT
jgi:hypothetical protein